MGIGLPPCLSGTAGEKAHDGGRVVSDASDDFNVAAGTRKADKELSGKGKGKSKEGESKGKSKEGESKQSKHGKTPSFWLGGTRGAHI
ncbi:hypothetical protein KJ359_012086 [Pestalotiopsis sp. 9143b]|nr:hypothetical protein KJ359_012086 [Pestalotiopsis sp. 9143b]